ncbi:MAG TPA: universal stress protein [Gaiellaceae bacterium]|nr:universal stress protein [Gaiellaceae bacterium]
MKILLAYDGSEGAKRALEVVVELVREGDRVTVVGVAEGVPLYGYAGTLPSEAQQEERRRQVEEAQSALARPGLAATLVLQGGDPAAAILDEAEKQDAELIVLGTRGLSTTERWLVGSVSTRVLHHARCSVLVAR